MQNRTMFPYRRPGQKKRPKNIANNHRGGKPKGPPPRGLPASVRELLPMLQPATKALAQMLAGRAQQSGQYGHARAVLARAERVVAERATDRLNPAEREEFFEQLARLKLTIADAEIEAEAVAEEAAAEPTRPAPPPVGRDRLREVALALAGPAPAEDAPLPAERSEEGGRPPEAPVGGPAAGPPSRPVAASPGASPAIPPAQAAAPQPAVTPPRGEPVGRPEQPSEAPHGRASAAETSMMPTAHRQTTGTGRRRLLLATSAPAAPEAPVAGEAAAGEAAAATSAGAGAGREVNGRTGRTRSPARRGADNGSRDKKLHLPEGWVIDEEGYVVPRSG
jgi:hypothetical protein